MSYNLVRNGTFETNSSSSHTISICEKTDFFTPAYQEEIVISGGDFGWGPDTLTSFQDRLDYVGQMIWEFMAHSPKTNHDNPQLTLEDLLKDQTGCKTVTWNKSRLSQGYVDHQSLDSSIFNQEDMKNLLFRTGSYIEIDNDNH